MAGLWWKKYREFSVVRWWIYLMLELIGFVDGLDVGCERKRGVKDIWWAEFSPLCFHSLVLLPWLCYDTWQQKLPIQSPEFKSKRGSQWVIQIFKGPGLILAGGPHGLHEKKYGRPIGSKTFHWWTAIRETGPQSYTCDHLYLVRNLNEPGSGLCPRAPVLNL